MEQLVYESPRSVHELAYCLRNADQNTYLLSGGTDLVIKLRKLGVHAGRIIDMTRLEALNYIKIEDGCIRIGANTTFADISRNEELRRYATCLAEAAAQVGSQQIRNTARMAGNVANSSPRGDSIPALLALDAKAGILNGKGEITYKKMDELVVGIGKNTLQKDEAIVEFLIPCPDESHRSTFGKFGRESHRTSVVISHINIAAVIILDKQGTLVKSARVVIGSAAPVPYRAEAAEKALTDNAAGLARLNAFVDALQKHVIESIHGNKRYENKIDGIAGLGYSVYDRLFTSQPAGGAE